MPSLSHSPSMRAWIFSGGLALASAGIFLLANQTLAGDIYWLLAGGRHISQHGPGLAGDPFLALAHGRPWYNQQWLAELFFYYLDQIGGMRLLAVVYALLLGLVPALLLVFCRRRPLSWTMASLLLTVASLAGLLDPRAAIFSVIAFSLMLVLTEAMRLRRSWGWLMLPLFALWANMHGGFVAGLLFLVLLVVGEGLAALDNRRRWAERLIPLGGGLVLALAALAFTPWGLGIVHYLGDIVGNDALPLMTREWRSTWNNPPALALWLAYLGFLLLIWRGRLNRQQLGPLLVSLGFALLALSAARQTIWLGPLAFFLTHRLVPEEDWRLSWKWTAAAAVMGTITFLAWPLTKTTVSPEPKLLTAAADVAARYPPSRGRILAPSGTGSYFLWRYPQLPVVIDGRLELYSTDELLNSYRLMNNPCQNLQLLDRWQVGAVLTRNPHAAAQFSRRGFRLVGHYGRGWYLQRTSWRTPLPC